MKSKIEQKILAIDVDTLYDFMNSNGSLYVQGAEQIYSNLKELTSYFLKNNVQIMKVSDYHTKESEELSKNPDWKCTFPHHCMQGTKGAESIDETKLDNVPIIYWDKEYTQNNLEQITRESNFELKKDKFNFVEGNSYTSQILDILNPDTVIIYGVATNVCVDYAVNEMLNIGKKVYVIKDAIKELPGLPLDEIIKDWKFKGVNLVSTKDIVNN
jgi:nicotinamidase/pyrazinamidase